jgi:hypothetical protein
MSKFNQFKKIVKSDSISELSQKELEFITGGLQAFDDGGSQTSGTGGNTPPCDNTCVCRCIPPIKKLE